MPRPPRFDAAWNARRRRAATWRTWRWWIGLAAVLAAAALFARWPGTGGDWQAVDARFGLCGEGRVANCVVDGDTVMLGERRVRLTGYDAPELAGKCEAERRLALLARAALADWLNRGAFALDGGAEPPRDAYGRELRAARRSDAAGQEWLAATMAERGLGRTDGARDWCAA
jgi:endonuclease YncB( thermonuclease family)